MRRVLLCTESLCGMRILRRRSRLVWESIRLPRSRLSGWRRGRGSCWRHLCRTGMHLRIFCAVRDDPGGSVLRIQEMLVIWGSWFEGIGFVLMRSYNTIIINMCQEHIGRKPQPNSKPKIKLAHKGNSCYYTLSVKPIE